MTAAVVAPHIAATDALFLYLQAQIKAAPGFGSSDAVDEWPDPTQDLSLGDARIVIGVTRVGAARGDDRLGAPALQKVTPGVSPAATGRYDFGLVEQDIAVGVWAPTRAMRDDADEVIDNLLNQPFWSTVSPLLTTPTTLPAGAKAGDTRLVPASMSKIFPGATLQIGSGATVDVVRVKDIGPTWFEVYAPLLNAHANTDAVLEVPGRLNEVAAVGVSLRCSSVTSNGVTYPGHLDQIARYDFDQPMHFDDAEDGAGSQRQEWRSVRNGTARIRYCRDLAVAMQVQLQVKSTLTAASSSTTTTKQVFP